MPDIFDIDEPENNEPDDEITEDEETDEDFEEYKAEQDAFNNSDEFFALYGFKHECRCAEDWAEGNLGVVSVCYLEMCRDALDKLKEAREQIGVLEGEIAQARILLAESGDEASA